MLDRLQNPALHIYQFRGQNCSDTGGGIYFRPHNILSVTLKLKFKMYKLHWSKELKDQPVLLLSSFVHYSSINEHKNMKLKENICYEMIS